MSKPAGNIREGVERDASAPSGLPSFDYQPRTRLVFSVNSVERVGELARELGAQRLLVVTDRGIVTVETLAYNQHGETVLSFKRRVMVPTRAYAEEQQRTWEEKMAKLRKGTEL